MLIDMFFKLQGSWYITATVNGSIPFVRETGTCAKLTFTYNPGNGTTSLTTSVTING